jgi:hypothetical protein
MEKIRALEEICENPVGRTMFKLLMTKLTMQKSMMSIVETHDPNEGRSYEDNKVYINLSFYKENGEGVPSRYYFYINEKREIKLKLKSLAGSVFHEFCHGLHDVSETEKTENIICQDQTEFGSLWGDDEELRTITCFNHDPICDHCFDFCQSILKNKKFLPRYSHGGYIGSGKPTTTSLREYYNCIPASQKYMDGWKEYIV